MLSHSQHLRGNERCSWRVDYDGRILVRFAGVVIYDGPLSAMPPDVKAIADQMTEPAEDNLPTLLLPKGKP